MWTLDPDTSYSARVAIIRVFEQSRCPEILLVLMKKGGVTFKQKDGTSYKRGRNWGIPGGRYDSKDSDLVTTALRELSEEAGIELTREQLSTQFSWTSKGPSRRMGGTRMRETLFFLHVTRETLHPVRRWKNEIETVQFFPLTELPTKMGRVSRGAVFLNSHRISLKKLLEENRNLLWLAGQRDEDVDNLLAAIPQLLEPKFIPPS